MRPEKTYMEHPILPKQSDAYREHREVIGSLIADARRILSSRTRGGGREMRVNDCVKANGDIDCERVNQYFHRLSMQAIVDEEEQDEELLDFLWSVLAIRISVHQLLDGGPKRLTMDEILETINDLHDRIKERKKPSLFPFLFRPESASRQLCEVFQNDKYRQGDLWESLQKLYPNDPNVLWGYCMCLVANGSLAEVVSLLDARLGGMEGVLKCMNRQPGIGVPYAIGIVEGGRMDDRGEFFAHLSEQALVDSPKLTEKYCVWLRSQARFDESVRFLEQHQLEHKTKALNFEYRLAYQRQPFVVQSRR